jgi:hypothetical protein
MVRFVGTEHSSQHITLSLFISIKKSSSQRLRGNDIALEKNRLSRSKVLDVPKNLLSCGGGSGSLKVGDALPLQRSLDLVRSIGGEVEDLPAQKTKRAPRATTICQFSILLEAQGSLTPRRGACGS